MYINTLFLDSKDIYENIILDFIRIFNYNYVINFTQYI